MMVMIRVVDKSNNLSFHNEIIPLRPIFRVHEACARLWFQLNSFLKQP
jgi:hypothetical protein